MLLKGLETLAVRVQRQTDTAATIAVALSEHAKVPRLIYPGRPDHPQAEVAHRQMRAGSTLVAFEVEGGKAGAFRFQDALRLIRISNNLGDAKSLITHPETTTHQKLTPQARAAAGVTSGLLRLSDGGFMMGTWTAPAPRWWEPSSGSTSATSPPVQAWARSWVARHRRQAAPVG